MTIPRALLIFHRTASSFLIWHVFGLLVIPISTLYPDNSFGQGDSLKFPTISVMKTLSFTHASLLPKQQRMVRSDQKEAAARRCHGIHDHLEAAISSVRTSLCSVYPWIPLRAVLSIQFESLAALTAASLVNFKVETCLYNVQPCHKDELYGLQFTACGPVDRVPQDFASRVFVVACGSKLQSHKLWKVPNPQVLHSAVETPSIGADG